MSNYIIIDSREPPFWKNLMKKLFESNNYEVSIKKLNYGDYESEKVIVERKSVSDFLNTITTTSKKTKQNRMDRQISGMVTYAESEGKIPLLLIHGNLTELIRLSEKLNNKLPNPMIVVRGYASLITRYPIAGLWVEDDFLAAEALTKFIISVDEGKYLSPRQSDKVALLARLLGISRKSAEELLKMCGGSIERLLDMDVKDLKKVKGIGDKKAKNIVNVLRGRLI